MDLMTILQIATISVSVLSVMINSAITVNEAKKNNFISVTTNQWKEMFIENRKHYSKLLSMCMPECIIENKMNGEYHTYKNDIRYISMQLMYYWKLYYKEEAELIEALTCLVDHAFNYYDCMTPNNLILLQQSLTNFYKLSSIYDSADWRLIRAQARGHDLNNDEFEKIYCKGADQFSNYDISHFFIK